MALDLSTLTTEQQLAAIYIGYYDRAADPVGEDFWEGAVANPNLSLADIATDFATQPETLIAYPFLSDPTAEEANAFITEVYLNLFNRAPDQAGLEFWSEALLAAIDGTGTLTVGEIILSIIEGAQDSAEGNDRTTILNKIEVATTWTNAAEAAGIDYTTDTAAQSSAQSIIEGVTDVQATVAAAKSTIDNFFEPAPVPGEEYLLTSATDVISGTSDDDEFNAYMQQNPFAGGISNSLSSADRLDGGAGNDRLYAELSFEFLGVSQLGVTDIQPRIQKIEEIDIEARDFGFADDSFLFDSNNDFDEDDLPIIVDAKNITDHVEIGSYYSDGDLLIENLTTLTFDGTARDTSDLTITMDHTDNFNSDNDASDLTVYFDNDYLLERGQSAESEIAYFLLDEDAELAGNPNRLNNIDVDGIRFTIENADGTTTDVTIESPGANVGLTHQGFVNALQNPLQALINDGTLPAGTRVFLDETRTTTTFIDDGSESDPIPAIVVVSGDGSKLTATGFSRIEEEIGEYDVFGRLENSPQIIVEDPISINIDLHKVGRGGDGGDLIIGGKSESTPVGIADGIEVFNINVLGAGNDDPNGGMTKPSNLGTITSTGNELREVYITTDPVFAAGDTYASLTVRNGFDQSTSGNIESGDLELINANAFLGDLTLGTGSGRITNADTITAQGGGDVSLQLLYDGNEDDQDYSVTTGAGDDSIDIVIDGDALDFFNSSLNVSTGDGDDVVSINSDAFNGGSDFDESNERLNQAILDNIEINLGDGDDMLSMAIDSKGNFNINAGDGDDFIDTSGGRGSSSYASWAFNYDDARDGASDFTGRDSAGTLDIPGVPETLAYVGGATVTVILSGAGISSLSDGGGVMALELANDGPDGADRGVNGYEASAVVEVAGPNTYYGVQSDVNAAVIAAITNDPVLSKLISLELTENNTWVATMTTGGNFDEVDLRVEINQPSQTNWTPVQTEARSLFSNSSLVVNSVATANTPTGNNLTDTAGTDAWYTGLSARGDDFNAADQLAKGEDVQIRDGAASLIEQDNVINPGDGDDLVVLSTDATNAQYEPGVDLGLLYTPIPGNTLQNGASNETIVLEGDDFGDDTIMNFTTGSREQSTISVNQTPATVNVTTQGATGVIEVTEAVPEIFTLEVSAPETGENGDINYGDQTVTITDTMSLADVRQAFIDAGDVTIGGVLYTPTTGPTASTVTFTETTPAGSDVADVGVGAFAPTGTAGGVLVGVVNTQNGDTTVTTPGVTAATEVFTVDFGDSLVDTTYTFDGETIPVLAGQTGENIAAAAGNGDYDNWTVDSVSGSVVTFSYTAGDGEVTDVTAADFAGTNAVVTEVRDDALTAGVDFLDFTDYLTSLYDSSSNPPGTDSSASNILIPVTLDYNETDSLGGSGDGSTDVDVEANEVAVVRLATDTVEGETYGALTATVVQNLFNGIVDTDDEWGGLAESEFGVQLYSKVDQEALIGDAKAIFMVENDRNLGEYKVFELTWNGDVTSTTGATVSAVELGSLDFGTSLTNLDDVNLVGSDDYANLIQNGFGVA